MRTNTVRFILSMALLSGCAEITEELEVKIYGQGAGFTGTYTVDGASEESSFVCNGTTSDVYRYVETVTVTEKLEINIFPLATDDDDEDKDETDMTQLTCKIYDSASDLVFEESYSINSTAMKSFVYEIGDTISTDI